MKIILDKAITRDWSLVFSESWYLAYMKEGKKVLNWALSENIYEGKNGMVTAYRAPSELLGTFRDVILREIEKDPKWLKKQSDILLHYGGLIEKMIEEVSSKGLKDLSSRELESIFKNYFEANVKFNFPYVVMLWFPIGMESLPRDVQDKYGSHINLAIEMRQATEKLGPRIDELFKRLCGEILRRGNIPADYNKYLSYNEAIDLLKKGKVNLIELKKRKKYFILTNEGILFEKIEDYAKRKGFELKVIDSKGVKEIKGQSAFIGKVKGKVRIINDKSKFKLFKPGEILVASMTTPDYLSILKESSAFITDEGGITCHAAIIARELKKPCVIGTKIATKVLNDGDLVEVDANKGVVRILEKTR